MQRTKDVTNKGSPKDQQEKCTPKTLKAYQSAQLLDLGDVRDVTLGGSPGLGDSGAEFSEDPP